VRKISCDQCALRATSCIASEHLEEFDASGVTALYRRRQVVFHEGTPAEGLYVLCHGAVKLHQSDRFGREHILGIAEPGDILGELPLENGETYSVSAEALSESQLCYLPRARLVKYIRDHPMAGVKLIAALSKALSAARRKAGDLALKRAEVRLAELLVGFAARGGETRDGSTHVTLAYSRREIAEMLGVSTETAIRLLGGLRRKKMLRTESRKLVIADLERLKRLADQGNTVAP